MISDELELAEIEFEIYCLAADVKNGLVPPDARRGMTGEELAAKVNFASIADDEDIQAGKIAVELLAARAALLGLLRNDLNKQGSTELAVRRLQELGFTGLASIQGAGELATTSAAQIVTLLNDTAELGRIQVVKEASAQGVQLGVFNAVTTQSRLMLDQQANRLATLPHQDLLRAVQEATVEVAPNLTIEKALGIVDATGQRLSSNVLDNLAHQASVASVGIGRIDVVAQSGPQPRIFSSELLDRNTCGPCRAIDGHEYKSVADLLKDYPAGIYVHCLGGMLCRGTPFYLWSTGVDVA